MDSLIAGDQYYCSEVKFNVFRIGPKFARLSKEETDVTFYKVDVDEASEVAEQEQIE